MTTRLLLICSAAPATAEFPADGPPSRAGLTRLAPLTPAAGTICLCSPLVRARQTADALGLSAQLATALRECDFGGWSGCDPARILAEDPAGFSAWLADPDAAPHGGESFAGMARRVVSWLQAQAEAAGPLVAITHPGPIRAMLLHVLGAPLTSASAIAVKPLSRTALTHDGRRWSVRIGT